MSPLEDFLLSVLLFWPIAYLVTLVLVLAVSAFLIFVWPGV